MRTLAKRKTVYVCQECGYEALKWMGKCTNCNNWNSFVEEVKAPKSAKGTRMASSTKQSSPTKISEIRSEKEPRMTTSMMEFNRVLGGGIVPEIGRAHV